jgi:hypothetical protein
VGGVLAAPDAPNGLCWTLTLWAAMRAMRGAGAWWLAAGAAAGLACLSKYSALFLAPGILTWLLATRDGRRALATPWPWLAGLIATAVFAPNVLWNADHGWITFAKQFGRARVGAWAPGYLVKFLVDQALLLNPLIALFVAVAIARRAAAPLLLVCAPFVLYLAFHSLHDEVQGQWPAPLYPLLMIAAAAAAEGATGPWRWARAAAAPLGLTLSAIILAFFALPNDGRLPFRDPARDIRAWPDLAAAAERDRTGGSAAWIGATDYGLAAALADQPSIHAPTTEVIERARFTFETPAERADFTKPGVVLAGPLDPGEALLRTCFAAVSRLPDLTRGGGRNQVHYQAWRVAGPLTDVERSGCDGHP